MRHQRIGIIILIILTTPFLTSCTPEKAKALLLAAKSFQTEAESAIDRFETLFIEQQKPPEQTREQQLITFVNETSAVLSRDGSLTNKDVIDYFGQTARKKREANISAELADIRQYYAMFADSLAALPQGSYFAATSIECSVDIAVRLTGSLVNYAQDLKENPILPERRISDLRGQYVAEAKKPDPDKARLNLLASQIDTLVTEGLEANEIAVRQTLVAATLGRQVVDLAQGYGQISVADILDIVSHGLSLANSMKGIDAASAISQLQEIRTTMEQDDYWKRILALPIQETSQKCKSKGGTN